MKIENEILNGANIEEETMRMTNDLAAELKALLKEGSGYNQTMTIEPLEDGEWCSITTSSIDVCGTTLSSMHGEWTV